MIKVAQFTLTADEAKRLIAYGVCNSELFKDVLINHRILFKGSTTVSALVQRALNVPLRICGRITENGMKANKHQSQGAHWLLWDKESVENVDENVEDIIKSFNSKDLFITGANAIDAFGNAALLIGSPGGGGYGKVLGATYTEGFTTLILTTSDKLIPGNIKALYGSVHRKGCDYAYGMACGLAPIEGEIITELEAVKLIADVEAVIFARGGVGEAAGASAIQISGMVDEVEKVLSAVDEIRKEKENLGEEVSLEECSFPSIGCGHHLSCKFSKKNTIHSL